MPEIILNRELAEVLTNHGIESTIDAEFVYIDLPSPIKLKARATYTQINDYTSSQLDVMVITENGETIVESFGDWDTDFETAISKNLHHFNISSLHPILAAFGCENPQIIQNLDIEQWEINGVTWAAYIGNLVPKTNSQNPDLRPPDEFFKAIVNGIRTQNLPNNLHWFRGYFMQHNNTMITTEFLMDNEDITATNPSFSSLPVIPGVDFYSCRNFIILKRL